MGEIDSAESRRFIERWIEEGQHLVTRAIPGLLAHLDRLRERTEAAEQASERLRQEIAELQTEVSRLRSENQAFSTERAELREVFGRAMEPLTQLSSRVRDILQRLQGLGT